MTKPRTVSVPKILKDDPVAKAKYRELLALALWQNAVSILGADPAIEYCLAHSRRINADEMLRTQGEVITSPNGYLMPSPWVAIRNRASDDMVKLAKLATSTVADTGKKAMKEMAASQIARSSRFASPRPPPKLIHSRKE